MFFESVVLIFVYIATLDELYSLTWMSSGKWTAFPPVVESNFIMNYPSCMQLWDSPPGEGRDHTPQRIEMIVSSNWV